MRHGGRIASCALGVVLVLSATVWINSRRPIRAQSPPLPAGEAKVAAPPVVEAVSPAAVVDGPALSQGAVVPALPQESSELRAPGLAESLPPPAQGPPPAPQGATAAQDPDQAAEAFVNQTRQQAEMQIKELTSEAEQLRARLKKVEAAIERWKTLRSALDRKPGQEAAGPVPKLPLESEKPTAPADLAFPVGPGPEATVPLPRDRKPAEPAPSALPLPQPSTAAPEPPLVDPVVPIPRAETPRPSTAVPEPPLKPR